MTPLLQKEKGFVSYMTESAVKQIERVIADCRDIEEDSDDRQSLRRLVTIEMQVLLSAMEQNA